ncbi:MAG: hypothetical protein Q4C46_08395 [Bacillota bacterium]|nr:hypothetical protein [Bacillota bacterium]
MSNYGEGSFRATPAGHIQYRFRYADRYEVFLKEYGNGRILLLELGVGSNTPQNHQISVLAADCSKQQSIIHMYQSRRSSGSISDQQPGYMYW